MSLRSSAPSYMVLRIDITGAQLATSTASSKVNRADLAVQAPTKYETVINLKNALNLSATIVLARGDRMRRRDFHSSCRRRGGDRAIRCARAAANVSGDRFPQ